MVTPVRVKVFCATWDSRERERGLTSARSSWPLEKAARVLVEVHPELRADGIWQYYINVS
jgi:hypothetical protein